ncbi:MAG: hypothetical protein HY815_10505 [Candidatus Riflebacteria bacterium]|nr:hypothetical protein [Candidatus Riflebacteria bacterium]
MVGLLGLALWQAADRPLGADLDRLGGWLAARRRRVLAGLIALSTVASLAVNLRILGGVPHTQDEIAYLFQARTLASGRLFVHSPPDGLASAFDTVFLVRDGERWYGKYPFGWPLVLALGVLVGLSPMVNPALNGLALLLFHRLLARHWSAAWALAGTALLALSPFFVMMGASFLSHPLCLVLLLVMIAAVERIWIELSSAGLAVGAAALGAASGLMVTARPFDALALTVPIALAVAPALARAGRRSVVAVALLVALPLSAVALTLAYNHALTGDCWLTPFLKHSPTDRPGFGPRVGTFDAEGHNFYKASMNLAFNMLALNEDLFGWPGLGLVVVGLGLVLPAMWIPVERLLLAAAGGIYLLYFMFMGHGVAFGARYYHVLLPFYVWFALRAFGELERRFGQRGGRWLKLFVPSLGLVSLLTYVPGRLDFMHDYWNVLSRPKELVSDLTRRPAVVVVPAVKLRGFRDLFDSFFTLNRIDPTLGDVVFVRDGYWVRGDRLRLTFPDREILRIPPGRLEPLLDQPK